ncbi:histidine kinase [Cytophagaceae bacterium DM2B3-1]|uniref:Histidine kinase n=1 Tax=Xanthocytophaga flava TaxID=3048013 RepID=A0ABT7CN11_9BACT|nr:histidine kinase [Xanthocytophaga flavus]MDJ1495107.1 histidine kinase [Xanthocytophaga flavus]
MKIRWREHEILLVTILTIITAISYITDLQRLVPWQLEDIRSHFAKDHILFSLIWNRLFPQIGALLVLYVSYLWINLKILPNTLQSDTDKKLVAIESKFVSLELISNLLPKKYIWGVVQFILISYLLALGANVASYFARPHYVNYGDFRILALFGYNDHPLTNLLAGFGRALALVCIYLAYVAIREFCIHFITTTSRRSSYYILVTNQITGSFIIFLCVPFFLAVFHLVGDTPFFEVYFAFIPPCIITYLYTTYWLFPLKGQRSFLHSSVIFRLLFILLPPLIFTFVAVEHYNPFIGLFWINVGLQLFIVTPVSWVLYQQKEDKILQLRGVEKELVRSKTDLQFLRSQINPHFLFNALNTLYGTAILDGSERTAEGIQKLGDMMRFMLHENNQDFISMHREIEYLKNYISLQKLRIHPSSAIEIEDTIDSQYCNHTIAPMLLIPFVENAFKHGISLNERSWIKIKLECDQETIRFEVRNSMHLHKSNDPEKEKSGIGLQNVLERLNLLYKHKHQFNAHGDGNEFVVQLVIQP